MKRIALAAAVVVLAFPAGALAAAGSVTFNARVVRSSALGLIVRRADGHNVAFSAKQIASVPLDAMSTTRSRKPLAHMAAGRIGIATALQRLDPGILVRVTTTSGAAARTVMLDVPKGAAGTRRAVGVVSAVAGGSILLDTRAGLELRLRGAVAGLRPCERASVVYHQDSLTLVADRVTVTGGTDCAR